MGMSRREFVGTVALAGGGALTRSGAEMGGDRMSDEILKEKIRPRAPLGTFDGNSESDRGRNGRAGKPERAAPRNERLDLHSRGRKCDWGRANVVGSHGHAVVSGSSIAQTEADECDTGFNLAVPTRNMR
jgi:hypothetical protein